MKVLQWCVLCVCVSWSLFCRCSGGGADISNPLTGVVALATSDGKKIEGARIVIGHKGVNPGVPTEIRSSSAEYESDSAFYFIVDALFFDTAYTDHSGTFVFEDLQPGTYTLLASWQEYGAIYYITKNADVRDWVPVTLKEQALIKLRMHEPVDTAEESHFIGMGIAGTDVYAPANDRGEVTFSGAPEGDLELLVYTDQNSVVRFPSLRTKAGETALLIAQPEVTPDRWVAHHNGPRLTTDRPYVVSAYFPLTDDNGASSLDSGKQFDLRVQFSDNMDALSTASAIVPYGQENDAAIKKLWWEGGNVLYVALCVSSDGSSCAEENSFVQGAQYGITIDTTAQSVHGVFVGFPEEILFIPEP